MTATGTLTYPGAGTSGRADCDTDERSYLPYLLSVVCLGGPLDLSAPEGQMAEIP